MIRDKPPKAWRSYISGAASILDEWQPGWHLEINTSKLNMVSVKDCILGQLFVDFWEGYDSFPLENYMENSEIRHWALYAIDANVPLVTRYWKEEIRKRKKVNA